MRGGMPRISVPISIRYPARIIGIEIIPTIKMIWSRIIQMSRMSVAFSGNVLRIGAIG